MKTTSKPKILSGALSIVQGIVLVLSTFWVLDPCLTMAQLLYAEDFDKLGSTPNWFWPWKFSMKYSSLIELSFIVIGATLIAFGVTQIKSNKALTKGFWATSTVALLLCLSIATAIIPLNAASMTSSLTWGIEAPAFYSLHALNFAKYTAWFNVLLSLLIFAYQNRKRVQ